MKEFTIFLGVCVLGLLLGTAGVVAISVLFPQLGVTLTWQTALAGWGLREWFKN